MAYCGTLAKHTLCATGITGKQVSEQTGLVIHRHMPGVQGGGDQIASKISVGEVDVLLFFRDAKDPLINSPSDIDLLRLCDIHNVPLATNIATAEALILCLQRGDLDWRIYGHPEL
jgi:methylglyoxal synthase